MALGMQAAFRDVMASRSLGLEVRIGMHSGAVVAGGAIVTKDVAPYAIVAGNPARKVRDRFPPDIAERLMRLGWQDWDHDRLRAALGDFRGLSVEAFLEKHGG